MEETKADRKRIALFVDGSNFFFMQKNCLQWWIDPKKLLDWVTERGQLADAFYYLSLNYQIESQKRYLRALEFMGYTVRSKQIKSFTLADGSERHTSNHDVAIITDLFMNMDNYDEAIMLTGDADFANPLEMLRVKGKQFAVLSTKGFVSHEIRRVAGSHYVDLQELRETLEKEQKVA